MFYNCRKGARDLYQILIFHKQVPVPSATYRWNTVFNINNDEWKKIFKLPHKILVSTRLKWFQTRINHRILGTNWLLNKINNNFNPNCSFCQDEIETIEHLFWECHYVRRLIHLFLQTLKNKNINLNLTKQSFIFGDFDNIALSSSSTVVTIWTKYYIYKSKTTNVKPSLIALQKYLGISYSVEKSQSIMRCQQEAFTKVWKSWDPYLNNLQ